MTNWALLFAINEPCLQASWKDNNKPNLQEFLVTDVDKMLLDFDKIEVEGKPLASLWQKGDRLITEVGGHSYAFCLQALSMGLEVFRFHSYELTRITTERGAKKGTEKGKSRKARLQLMVNLAQTEPKLLYKMTETDKAVSYIAGWIDEYVEIQQEQRIRAQLRANVRKMNIAWMPAMDKGKHIERVKKGFTGMEIEYFLALEADLIAAIKKELPNVQVWSEYLEGINGCGPSIAARIIGAVRDIKRFPKLGGFRSECGWRVVDGKAAKFRRGKEEDGKRITMNCALKQAMFLFADQVVRGGEKNPYNATYRRLKKFYTDRDSGTLTKKHIDNRARRAAVSDFIDDLWEAWWKIEETSGTPLPQSVHDVLYAVDTLS